MFNPAPSFYEGFANWLEIARYDINQEWRGKQLTRLLQELEPMNIRLRELEESRLRAGRASPNGVVTVIDSPTPGSFAEATAAVLKPAAPAAKPIASAAAKIAALTKDRLAFNDELSNDIDAYSKKMAGARTRKSAVFTKANAAIDDEMAGFDQLDTALTDFEGANTPLAGS